MPELTVIAPAYRERDNIPELLAALERSLEGRDWETIIVVDDALDGTDEIVRDRAQQDRTLPRLLCARACPGSNSTARR